MDVVFMIEKYCLAGIGLLSVFLYYSYSEISIFILIIFPVRNLPCIYLFLYILWHINVSVASDLGRHLTTTSCRVAANKCLLDTSIPCSGCEVWSVKTWNKLRNALGDARMRAIQRGNPYWISASPQIEAWVTIRSASVAASSEPGSEFSSLAGSGDDLSSVHQIVSTKESVLGDFEVHESIGFRSNMADSGCCRPQASKGNS